MENEYKQKMRVLQEQNRSLANQVATAQRTDKVGSRPKDRRTEKSIDQNQKKKDSGGCCGTGCLIM